jgi:DHA2 family multidrug resistance protein-like MFS transporter
MAAGILIGGLFVRRQQSLAHPLIDLKLFKIAAFTASLLVNLAGMFFVFGVFLYQNLFLQFVLGLSPLAAALWSVPSSLAFTIMSLQAYRITNRFGPINTVLCGLIVNAAGTLAMAFAAYGQSLVGILSSSMLIALGFVPVVLTTTGLIVGTAPPERAGSASAISETSAEFGGALGVALLGSLGTIVYRMLMSGTEIAGIAPQQAAAARLTIGGAVETAKTLAWPEPPAWLEAARDAFSMGFAACCLLSSVTLLALAAAARRIYATTEFDGKTSSGHQADADPR